MTKWARNFGMRCHKRFKPVGEDGAEACGRVWASAWCSCIWCPSEFQPISSSSFASAMVPKHAPRCHSWILRFQTLAISFHLKDALAERSKAVAQGAIPKWVRTPQASLFLLKRGWWLQLTASDTLFQGCCQRPTLTLVAQSV